MSKHHCTDPRCAHESDAKIFKRVKKNGLAIIVVYDEPMPGALTAYTVGVYANYNLPELLMWFESGTEYETAVNVVIMATTALLRSLGADIMAPPKKPQLHPRQARPLAIKYGHEIDLGDAITLHVWPEDAIGIRPFRQTMTATENYYREVFMTPFEHVPVGLLSWRPFYLCDDHQEARDRHESAPMN